MSRVAKQIHTVPEEKLLFGWSLATIEDLVGANGVFVDGDWVESKDQDPTGDVRLIQLADIGDGEYRNKSDRFLTTERAIELGCTFLMRGDVLVARMPDPLGRACIFPGDPKKSVTVVDVAIVRSGNGEFNHRWLMYFINAPVFRASVASLQSGSTRKRISRGNLARITLPVPPREQQSRIVAEIEKQFSRLDEAVGNLKRVKANLKRYKAAVLKAAVEGKLIPLELKSWRKKTLGELGKWLGGGTPSKLNPGFWTGGRIPWVSPKDMKTSKIADSEDHITKDAVKNSATSMVPANSVLVVTRSGILKHTLPVATCSREVAINQDLKALRPNDDIDPEYVALALRAYQEDILHQCAKAGTTVQNIEFPVFLRFKIPVPHITLQRRIVGEVERRLSVIDGLEAAVVADQIRADRLRQSVLARAFEGKLVPQSLSDEPASVLLSRLSAASALKDSLQLKGIRKPGGTTMPKHKAEHSGEIGRMNTKSLYQILRDSEKRLTPEQLFANAGFGPELIDEFYEELKRETQAGRILQERPNKTAVYLKAI